jgi:hypothetical protein
MVPTMTKMLRAYSVDAPRDEMARFELLPDGQVKATYANESLRTQHETVGVFTARTGRVRLEAGRRFLELSLSTSSFLRLEDA